MHKLIFHGTIFRAASSKQTNEHKYEYKQEGEDTGGTNNNMCSASARLADTVCVQSDLKYNSLYGKCLERIHYNTLHWVTRQQFFSERIRMHCYW